MWCDVFQSRCTHLSCEQQVQKEHTRCCVWLHLPGKYGTEGKVLHLKKQTKKVHEAIFTLSNLNFDRQTFTTVADWKETMIEKSQKRALLDNYHIT